MISKKTHILFIVAIISCTSNAVPTRESCDLCLKRCGHLISGSKEFLSSIQSKVQNEYRTKRQILSEEYHVKDEYDRESLIWDRKPIYYEHEDTDYTDFHEQNDNLDIICHFKESLKPTEYEESRAKELELSLPVDNGVRDRVIWDQRPLHTYDSVMNIMDFKDTDGEHNCPMTIYEEPYPMSEGLNQTSSFNKTNATPHENSNSTKDSIQAESSPKYVAQSSNKRQDNKYLLNIENCGLALNNEMSQGNNATPGQFPWLVRIAYRNTSNNRISYRCSGSVVSKNAIVTAAHCVKNLVKDLVLAYVLIGDDPNSFQMYEITEIISHPEYDKPKYAHDIALIRFKNTDNLSTICLPINNSEVLNGSGVFAGWYANIRDDVQNNETQKGFVQFINLSIVNNSACSEAYGRFSVNEKEPIVIRSEQLCAISEETEDVCQGDSGGPFMRSDSSGSQYTLLGVVAFGLAQPGIQNTMCGAFDFPTVYTRVSAYNNWILSELQYSDNKVL